MCSRMDSDTFTVLIERLQQHRSRTSTSPVNIIFKDVCLALQRSLEVDICGDMVIEAVHVIVQSSIVEGLHINDALQLWKLYLHFLKQHQDKINETCAETVVATINTCISDGLDIFFLNRLHFTSESDSIALSRKLQLLLFFCQRVITTVVYLSAKLCDDTILQCFENLLLCRGVCFFLSTKLRDQAGITAMLSKFDTLFSSALELQPSQLHREGQQQRRVQLYRATAMSACICVGSRGVSQRLVVLGVLTRSSSSLCGLKVPLLAPVGGGDRTATVLQDLVDMVRAAECLNTCFCGDIADEVICSLVLDVGQHVCQIILHSGSQVNCGHVLRHLIQQCLCSGYGGASGCVDPFRAQVKMAWSRLLLVTVFSSAGRATVARDRQMCSGATGCAGDDVKEFEGSAEKYLPSVVLGTLLAIVVARGGPVTPTLPLGLLCRAMLIATVSLCLNEHQPSSSCCRTVHVLEKAAQDLKLAILSSLEACPSSESGPAALELALPFPDILSIADEGVVAQDKKCLQSVTRWLTDACGAKKGAGWGSRSPPISHMGLPHLLPSSGTPSACQALNILSHHCPASSLLNENTAFPNPLLSLDHDVSKLAFLLLKNVSILVRFISRASTAMIDVGQVSKKRSSPSSLLCRQPQGLWDGASSAQVSRVVRGLLLSLVSLQHVLPVMYCASMRDPAAALLDHAVVLAKLFSSLARGTTGGAAGLQKCQKEAGHVDVVLLNQLLQAACESLNASVLCNGLINEESTFTQCRATFLLLFEGLWAACNSFGSPITSHQEKIVTPQSTEDRAAATATPQEHLLAVTHSLAMALMWSSLLHTLIDFGEKVRVYPKLKHKVATLIPKNMIHLVQARAGGCTAPLLHLTRTLSASAVGASTGSGSEVSSPAEIRSKVISALSR